MHVPTSICLVGSLLLGAALFSGASDDGGEAPNAAGERARETPGDDGTPGPLGASGDSEVSNSTRSAQNSELSSSPERVILRISRNREVAGFVELENDDVIVVRTPAGEIESFSKIRILQIARLVDPEPEQIGIVVLHNGQRRRGVIIEDTFDHVVIEAEGIRTVLRREVVDQVILEPTFERRYEEFRASIEPGMLERHLVLCRWLVENRRYDLARKNLLEILAQKEVHEARRMLQLVDAQLELLERSSSRETAPRPPRELPSESAPPTRLLTREEVNLIRVYELDFDNPPRVAVNADTIRRLIANYATNPLIPASQAGRNALFRADPLDIVRLMFELRARELYGEIEVLSEPPSLNHFRLRIHDTWLMKRCAACHSGSDAGRFALHRTNHRDDRVRYTNLLILERLDVDPQWPLINYDQPEMSLLIQHALPREMARLPHPDVPEWTPAFTRADDARKDATEQWIRSMMQPRPDYPIEFDPNPRKQEPATETLHDEDALKEERSES